MEGEDLLLEREERVIAGRLLGQKMGEVTKRPKE